MQHLSLLIDRNKSIKSIIIITICYIIVNVRRVARSALTLYNRLKKIIDYR